MGYDLFISYVSPDSGFCAAKQESGGAASQQ